MSKNRAGVGDEFYAQLIGKSNGNSENKPESQDNKELSSIVVETTGRLDHSTTDQPSIPPDVQTTGNPDDGTTDNSEVKPEGDKPKSKPRMRAKSKAVPEIDIQRDYFDEQDPGDQTEKKTMTLTKRQIAKINWVVQMFNANKTSTDKVMTDSKVVRLCLDARLDTLYDLLKAKPLKNPFEE